MMGIVRRIQTHRYAWVSLGAVVAVMASIMPLSHDEAFWLAITRKVETGAHLYVGAIDNKSPLVYLVMYPLDTVPGPFPVARGLLIGALVACIGLLVTRLGRALESSANRSVAVGVVVCVVAALQSELVFTVELLALAALVGTLFLLVRNQTLSGSLLAVVAISFDPRTVLLLPGLVLFCADQRGWPVARRFAAWTGGLASLGLLVVLLHPDLRYGLIELNLGSRTSAGGWRPAAQVAVALRSLLPLAVISVLLRPFARANRRRAIVWLMFGGLAIGAVSALPFDHYWSYVLPGFVLFVSSPYEPPARSRPIVAAVAIGVALAPLILNNVATGIEQRKTVTAYAEAAAVLRARITGSDQFVSFDIKPYMAAELPEAFGMRSPVSGYLVWPTSRSAAYLDELPSLIDGAVAISEDGGLAADQDDVAAEYRPVWRIFHERLGGFPCLVDAGEVVLRFRAERCPT